MPYSSYKNIGAVAKEFQVKYIRNNFISEAEFPISEFFRQELELMASRNPYFQLAITLTGAEYNRNWLSY